MANKEAATESVELVVNKLSQAFEYLAAKAGVAADHFWPILVKQQVVEGVVWILGTVFVIAVTFASAKQAQRAIDKDSDFFFAVGLIAVVGGFCSAIGVLGIMHEAIGQIINPEYYAIKEVLSFAK